MTRSSGVDRLAQAFEDVRALLGAREVVLRPPRDDLAAERDELLEHLLEVDDLRAGGRPAPA